MLCYVMLCYVMLCYAISRHIISYHIISYNIMPYHRSYHIIPYYRDNAALAVERLSEFREAHAFLDKAHGLMQRVRKEHMLVLVL